MTENKIFLNERYIINEKGEKVEVILSIEIFEKLLNLIQDHQDYEIVKKAMNAPKEEWLNWDQVKEELDV